MRNSPANAKVREDRGEGGGPYAGAETALQPLEGPHWNRFIQKGCSLWTESMLEKQEKK